VLFILCVLLRGLMIMCEIMCDYDYMWLILNVIWIQCYWYYVFDYVWLGVWL